MNRLILAKAGLSRMYLAAYRGKPCEKEAPKPLFVSELGFAFFLERSHAFGLVFGCEQ